ncbi:MAG: hypothetical protein HC802_17085 [Caldilineaceae bacterium]|nr:hypothetical protein [Caldilineaceae bacterium]
MTDTTVAPIPPPPPLDLRTGKCRTCGEPDVVPNPLDAGAAATITAHLPTMGITGQILQAAAKLNRRERNASTQS